jgi:hypothetical protein
MANVGQIRTCGWLDFTKDLEFPGHPIGWVPPNAGPVGHQGVSTICALIPRSR